MDPSEYRAALYPWCTEPVTLSSWMVRYAWPHSVDGDMRLILTGIIYAGFCPRGTLATSMKMVICTACGLQWVFSMMRWRGSVSMASVSWAFFSTMVCEWLDRVLCSRGPFSSGMYVLYAPCFNLRLFFSACVSIHWVTKWSTHQLHWKKVKVAVSRLMELHLTATECHLSYEITQCYLTPDTSEHTPPWPQPDRLVLDLPTPERWKAELT